MQASSRTFLIQRGPDQMDPDPKNRVLNIFHTELMSHTTCHNRELLQMMLMRILPWMLVIVTNSLILWTVIAGLFGWYLICTICSTYPSSFIVVPIRYYSCLNKVHLHWEHNLFCHRACLLEVGCLLSREDDQRGRAAQEEFCGRGPVQKTSIQVKRLVRR